MKARRYITVTFFESGSFVMPANEFETPVGLTSVAISGQSGVSFARENLFFKSIVTTGSIKNSNGVIPVNLYSGINGPIVTRVSLGIKNVGGIVAGPIPIGAFGPRFIMDCLGTQKYTFEDGEVILEGTEQIGSLSYAVSMSNIQPSGAGIANIYDAGPSCTYEILTEMVFGIMADR